MSVKFLVPSVSSSFLSGSPPISMGSEDSYLESALKSLLHHGHSMDGSEHLMPPPAELSISVARWARVGKWKMVVSWRNLAPCDDCDGFWIVFSWICWYFLILNWRLVRFWWVFELFFLRWVHLRSKFHCCGRKVGDGCDLWVPCWVLVSNDASSSTPVIDQLHPTKAMRNQHHLHQLWYLSSIPKHLKNLQQSPETYQKSIKNTHHNFCQQSASSSL